ncbi:MAG: GGDEF domain-containing protein [Thermoleophilia bacterium]|jgi:diguanylate cyclase (GGDEF)-like protein
MIEEHPVRDSVGAVDDYRYVRLLNEVERNVQRYRRYRRPFSVLTTVVQNLRWIDDNLGEAAGNAALEQLTDLTSTHTREVDIWFRCRRDLLVIVMEETDTDGARAVAERLTAEIQKTDFLPKSGGATLQVGLDTVSCPNDAVDAEELLRAVGVSPSKATGA